MLCFETLNLKKELLEALEEMHFTEMTPIQEQAIPLALEGRDVIGQAQTGTGKTAAFAIPFLQRITEEERVQVLVLTPTRELCIQVEQEVRRLSKYLPVHSLAVYGGQEITRQIRELQTRPQILVATPGRLLDHMRRRTIRLEHLSVVVLDEADEMLNMGFLEDIETILSACPEDRQTMMFSATMREEIQSIANRFMRDPQLVRVKAQELTVPAIEQQYFEVPEQEKLQLLCRLLDIHNPERAMIFGRTKRRVDELTEALQKLGYRAEGLHGDLTQRARDTVMQRFRSGQIQILVATDVAARGLDITGVTHVFNFDLPQEIDSYVHRIGRTGRAGKEGMAITFVEPREFAHLKTIERTIHRKLTKTRLPSAQDSRQKQQVLLQEKIETALRAGRTEHYRELADALLRAHEGADVLAAALELLAGDVDREAAAARIHLSAEKPIYVKRGDGRQAGDKRAWGQNIRGGRGGYYGGAGGRASARDGRYARDAAKKRDYSARGVKPTAYGRDGKKSGKRYAE